MRTIIILVLIFLSLAKTYCYLPVSPRGWKPCNRFWTRRCDRFCIKRGYSLGYCWINKRWLSGYRGLDDAQGDWDNYYRNSLNNNYEGIFLQVEIQSHSWIWNKFVKCRCKFYNNNNEAILD